MGSEQKKLTLEVAQVWREGQAPKQTTRGVQLFRCTKSIWKSRIITSLSLWVLIICSQILAQHTVVNVDCPGVMDTLLKLNPEFPARVGKRMPDKSVKSTIRDTQYELRESTSVEAIDLFFLKVKEKNIYSLYASPLNIYLIAGVEHNTPIEDGIRWLIQYENPGWLLDGGYALDWGENILFIGKHLSEIRAIRCSDGSSIWGVQEAVYSNIECQDGKVVYLVCSNSGAYADNPRIRLVIRDAKTGKRVGEQCFPSDGWCRDDEGYPTRGVVKLHCQFIEIGIPTGSCSPLRRILLDPKTLEVVTAYNYPWDE